MRWRPARMSLTTTCFPAAFALVRVLQTIVLRQLNAFKIEVGCSPRARPSSARSATSTCGGSRSQLSLAAVALFGVTLIPDVLDTYGVIHIPSWLTMGSIDDARAILSAMMGAVATVLALIFSVALLVLSMVATLFGPRLLYRFLQDWVTQVTIGLFMGTFIYVCLVFLVTHQDPHSAFIPQISLITSWVLVVVSFAFLVYYSHRIATSIQNPDMIARIVDDLYSRPAARTCPAPARAPAPRPTTPRFCARPRPARSCRARRAATCSTSTTARWSRPRARRTR